MMKDVERPVNQSPNVFVKKNLNVKQIMTAIHIIQNATVDTPVDKNEIKLNLGMIVCVLAQCMTVPKEWIVLSKNLIVYVKQENVQKLLQRVQIQTVDMNLMKKEQSQKARKPILIVVLIVLALAK